MKISDHIRAQFIAPDGSNRLQVEQSFSQISSQLLDFLCSANESSPLPGFVMHNPEYFKFPPSGQALDKIQRNLQILYAQSMNPANSNYIGHMDSIPTMYSILGDYIASAINNNMLSLEMSPYLTQLEYSLTQQFATLFGLPTGAGGVMLSGGTLSNLQALIVARNSRLNIKDGNVYSLEQEPLIFTSELSHVSIQKSAMLIGIGANSVIKIKTNADAQMDIHDLETQLETQIKASKRPFVIIATAGTTVTGNIDPLKEISAIAKKYNLWLHVDAIYGGALVLNSNYKPLLEGIELADSIAFNPQKWLYVAKTSSMVLFRDFAAMADKFRTTAPYMKEQSDFINLGEISIQGSKHAEVLKLWLSLLSLGQDGYWQLIEYSYFLTTKFVNELKKRNYFKLATMPQTNVICFRVEQDNISDKEQYNTELQTYLLNKAGFFVSLPKYKGETWLRVVLLNPFLTEDIIDSLFEDIDDFIKMKA